MEIFMARSIAAMASSGPNETGDTAGDKAGDKAAGIEFVLFDLGGVLIEVGGVGPMRELSGIQSDEELWSRWLACPWVRRLEAGQCGAEEFAAGVVADWDLGVSPDEFLSGFLAWQGSPYPGATELVGQVKAARADGRDGRGAEVGVGCLSNTNAVQWAAHFEGTPLLEAFQLELRFLSFELGLVKPDPEIFEAVAARLPVRAAQVLFLDDNAVNVEAASANGFTARRVQGPAEARRALQKAGVLAR
jgi:glucose-1-phosphatase